jgi:hypothetical protein
MLQAQTPLTIVTTTLPAGSLGIAYLANITVTGGVAPYSWSVTGNLPPGLQISGTSTGGAISGTPASAGTYTFNLAVTDSQNSSTSGKFTIAIQSLFVISTSSPLPSAIVGQSYNQTLTAVGGVAPYQWSAGSGFPPGLTLNASSGAITGAPTTAGNYSFPVQVTDSTKAVSTATFSLAVTGSSLQITTVPPLFNGQIGAAYSQPFAASGGSPPYTWSLGSGSSGGLTLDPNSGILSGMPQTAGTFTFVVKVTDSAGVTVSKSFSVTVTPQALIITAGGTLPAGTAGLPYDQKFSVAASGGTPPYTWTLSNGSVPGLVFKPATVELSGTPTSAATYSLTLEVTDSAGLTATKVFTLLISPAALSITTARQLSAATLDVPFSETLVAAGGSPPYNWSANGLPAGLTINSSSGVLSGTPTAAGSFTPVITVTDSSLDSFRDNFTISVSLPAPPSLTISGLTAASGAAQQFPLQITLGSAYAAAMQGQLILSFQPNSGPGDSTIQFSTGGSTVSFSIPLGSTTATFLGANGKPVTQLQIQTGTAAGTIVVSLSNLTAGGVDITPTPAPSIATQIASAAPVITNTLVVRNADSTTGCQQGQICIEVTGYATARQVTQATFTFTAAAGQTLQSAASSITVDVSSLFSSWFASSTMGSQFVFVQPFTVSGDPTAVLPATVTLTNRVGSTTANVNP